VNLSESLRQAMRADGRTVYALSRDSGLAVSVVQRFAGGRGDLTLKSASKLCEILGWDLRPASGKGAK
jgi:hypothetical protein